jgi:hypothetical protein
MLSAREVEIKQSELIYFYSLAIGMKPAYSCVLGLPTQKVRCNNGTSRLKPDAAENLITYLTIRPF